ncbi:MAG: DUF2461 domain-containing protein [Anaerolineae bacterium]
MKTQVHLKPALDFLADLAVNNNRAWFTENRERYDQARTAFEMLVESLIAELEKAQDLGGITARDCMMRIHRDMRFSRDKTPYRINFGANIVAGGRKSGRLGYYIHLQPGDQSFIASGLYEPGSDQLARFRQAIARDASAFNKIVKARLFVKNFGAVGGERLSRVPRGYPPDHPEIELLRLKQVLVMHPVADRDITSPDFAKQTLLVCKAMKPFIDYMNSVIA